MHPPIPSPITYISVIVLNHCGIKNEAIASDGPILILLFFSVHGECFHMIILQIVKNLTIICFLKKFVTELLCHKHIVKGAWSTDAATFTCHTSMKSSGSLPAFISIRNLRHSAAPFALQLSAQCQLPSLSCSRQLLR